MSHSSATAPIELPRWYAGLALDAPADELGCLASAADTVRIGPLAVFNARQGCEIATFGSTQRSSAVIFDGYLLDRAEVAAELGLGESVSTAELVTAAYRRWGVDIFDRLDGCYLIAVWDAGTRRLLIGHDGLGRHPAFYAFERGAVWFGSNVLALASGGHVSNTPNRLSLALAMLLYWPEAGQTFFERIRRVRPGHYLEITSQHDVSERKYWDPMPADDEPWLPEEQVLEDFEPALTRAVSRCMALGPQGIMLSGGVDSVTVAALAANYGKAHGTPTMVAVSGRANVSLSQEERMQSRVADALEMPHLVSTTAEWTQGRDDISSSLEITPELPSPSRIYWVGTYTSFYRQAAAQHLNVLLTGSGGDNWLAVADTHAADLMRSLQLLKLLRFVKSAIATGGYTIPVAARRLLWSGGLRPLVDTLWARMAPERKTRYHWRKWHERLPHWLCPDATLKEELVHHLVRRRTPALTDSGAVPRNYYHHSLRSTANPYVYYEFETGYHVETWCGLRLLSPYHDRRLVSFFNRIPPDVLVHGNRYKGLLRPVVAKHLPALGFENQRKDYPRQAQDLMLTDLRRSVVRAWPAHRFDVLGRLGVVDSKRAECEIEQSGSYGSQGLTRMFALMSGERWVRAHTSV